MSVADVLQFLAAGRKTGTLKIGRGSIIKQIYLEDGLIVGSTSNDPKEFLGQVLLHYGKIDEAQLQTAMDIHRQSGGKLGMVLSARGFVSEADIMEVLRTRTLEIIYDLFIWEEADFEFYDSEPLPHDLIRIQVNATSVEAMRKPSERDVMTGGGPRQEGTSPSGFSGRVQAKPG